MRVSIHEQDGLLGIGLDHPVRKRAVPMASIRLVMVEPCVDHLMSSPMVGVGTTRGGTV